MIPFLLFVTALLLLAAAFQPKEAQSAATSPATPPPATPAVGSAPVAAIPVPAPAPASVSAVVAPSPSVVADPAAIGAAVAAALAPEFKQLRVDLAQVRRHRGDKPRPGVAPTTPSPTGP